MNNMDKIWADCLLAGTKNFADARPDRQLAIKAELERRLAIGGITQAAFNEVFGIDTPPDEI